MSKNKSRNTWLGKRMYKSVGLERPLKFHINYLGSGVYVKAVRWAHLDKKVKVLLGGAERAVGMLLEQRTILHVLRSGWRA